MTETEKQILQVVENNLPIHVGEALAKRLAKLTEYEEADYEMKLERLEEENYELRKKDKDYEQRLSTLLKREKDMDLKAIDIKIQEEILKMREIHCNEIKNVYKDVNEKLLANRSIRESIHTNGQMPKFTVYEYRDGNGNTRKDVVNCGVETVYENTITTKEEK